ncbi:phage shock protein PspA [Marinomonas rhizomae]|uniref:Phage shock protein A (PspA) family protein n=1 Tax=Marinomonas rhizomae TaxID=491948 RepID=A0A366JCU1_9GAMM|nr:phage shock protein PspA [Marinomonas rhizomae]RBP83728.1 phage shock protein A (PspA) family protein [Marinomonas rhizomae]RNF69714.1 phage shock protein PspA [Marinomonas rhizomae]
MGIFSRMTDIINSNLTSLLDKAEDPKKMIRMMIQEMEETLVEVRSSSARVIADRKTTGRRLERMRSEAAEWESKAMLAIHKGREDLARAALSEKQQIEKEIEVIDQELSALDEHLEHLNEEVGQLQIKLNDAKAKQKAMLLRQSSVESRMRVKRQNHKEALDDAFEKFERFERRVDSLEGQLESMDIGMQPKADLKSQIDALAEDDGINDELARLKEKMTKTN